MCKNEEKSFRLSPSSLTLMKECKRCFWLTHHNIWKRPTGIFPSLPSGMDKILKIHFDKFRKENKLPPELAESIECSDMKLFENEELLKIWQDNRKGISWIDKEGNELRGAIDNLLVKNEKIIVLDYKTRGYALKENTHEYYQMQMDIYNFLFYKNNYPTENFAFLLFYVPKEVLPTGEIIFDTTLKKINTSLENAERVWKDALMLLHGDCPKERCEWCERTENIPQRTKTVE
ncbi:PD-(D/E)XK nuclease family protein [Patescibacteria group bacterium]|nr:PD-(D/E)XK nuclease family protein [Patescibacteria group bacterium]